MVAIGGAILLITMLIFVGSRKGDMGLKTYFIIFLATLAQIAIFVLFMLTFEYPVLK